MSGPDTLDFFELEASINKYEGDRVPDAPWDPCVLCDRPIRTDRPYFEIVLVDHGSTLMAIDAVTDEIENADHYHGSHTIGPGCRKKVPAKFYYRVKP